MCLKKPEKVAIVTKQAGLGDNLLQPFKSWGLNKAGRMKLLVLHLAAAKRFVAASDGQRVMKAVKPAIGSRC